MLESPKYENVEPDQDSSLPVNLIKGPSYCTMEIFACGGTAATKDYVGYSKNPLTDAAIRVIAIKPDIRFTTLAVCNLNWMHWPE